jgi:glycosyltransferase involved in cell wall biosynthesis
LTEDEATDYRRFGCKQPIAVIPNGVNIPRCVDTACFLDRFPDLRGKKIVLFLGRLHHKKGLDILLHAWSSLAADFKNARLVIAGPDSDQYQSTLEALVEDYKIAGSVVFTGMLKGEMKWSALATAMGFILPSYSEGFSVAALEAMGMGLPVIVSSNCHLPEVRMANAGWVVNADAESVQDALVELLLNSAANNAEMGNHGRRLVQERYSWQRVAHQMAELYGYVQGGAAPQTFRLQEANQ